MPSSLRWLAAAALLAMASSIDITTAAQQVAPRRDACPHFARVTPDTTMSFALTRLDWALGCTVWGPGDSVASSRRHVSMVVQIQGVNVLALVSLAAGALPPPPSSPFAAQFVADVDVLLQAGTNITTSWPGVWSTLLQMVDLVPPSLTFAPPHEEVGGGGALRELQQAASALDVSSSGYLTTRWNVIAQGLRVFSLSGDMSNFRRCSLALNTFEAFREAGADVHYAAIKDHARALAAAQEWGVGNPPSYSPPAASGLAGLPPGVRVSHQSLQLAYLVTSFEGALSSSPRPLLTNTDFIVEFGGGSGALAGLLSRNLGFTGRYVLFDVPMMSLIQRYYLRMNGIQVFWGGSPPDVAAFLEDAQPGAPQVLLTSDVAVLAAVCGSIDPALHRTFVATWSLSEAPVPLRTAVTAAVSSFDRWLVVYQPSFTDVDNLHFFSSLGPFRTAIDPVGDPPRGRLHPVVVWHDWRLPFGGVYSSATDRVLVGDKQPAGHAVPPACGGAPSARVDAAAAFVNAVLHDAVTQPYQQQWAQGRAFPRCIVSD